ncbi:MAG: hypothetical protein HY828_07460 [Actinobacteria bacterium]|nr:hypothetical protein [Actinomycetota bacterium]
MNDDAHSPELELASAYLDGDVDEVQRAQVESSPELMALVASFGQVKAGLRDTPPVDAVARDTAVLAALAEFDVLRAPPVAAVASAAATGNVVPLQRRARFSRVVMSAAAALLIGGVGVVAVNSFGGSSNDQSSSADPAAAKELADDTAGSVAGDAAGGAPPQTIGAINGAASAVPALDEPEDLMAFAATPAPNTLASGAETTSFAGGTETTAAGEVSIAEAATETVADATQAPTTRAVVPSFEFDCPLEPTQIVVVEITWKGTPAVAVRDTVSGVIQAIDAQCTVLATVEP